MLIAAGPPGRGLTDSAIISPKGGNVRIGFALPINMARRVMEQIIQYGDIRRGRIGVAMQDPTRTSPRLSERLTARVPSSAASSRIPRPSE